MIPKHHDHMREILVDREFAEPVLLRFLHDKQDDPDRPDVEIEALLDADEGNETNAAGGYARSWQARSRAQSAKLKIYRAKYPDIAVRTGDEVQALARPGKPFFEVLAVDDRDMMRLVLHLGEAV